MDGSNSAVIDAVSSRKALPPTKRQYRSAELKRQIVEETLAPGASVARVARAHGVNANQVFAWRRQYQRELLKSRNRAMPGLWAVRVAEAGAHVAINYTSNEQAADEVCEQIKKCGVKAVAYKADVEAGTFPAAEHTYL